MRCSSYFLGMRASTAFVRSMSCCIFLQSLRYGSMMLMPFPPFTAMMLVIARDDQTGGDQGFQEVDDRIELLIELRQVRPLCALSFPCVSLLGILRCSD